MLGHAGQPAMNEINNSSVQIYWRELQPSNNTNYNSKYAVVFFNVGTENDNGILNFNTINIPNTAMVSVRDLWLHKDLGTFKNQFNASNIASHDCLMLLLQF